MSNTPLKAVRNLSFTTTNVSDPCVFIEVEQHQTGFAIGISGAASSIEIDQTGTVYTTGNLNVAGNATITGTLTATTISGTQIPTTAAAHKALIGPTSGGAVAPTFRLLVAGDIPDLSATYQAKSAINTAGGYSQLVAAPATASSAGAAGQEAYDSGFYYRCVATNTWVRVAIATF